MRKRGVIFARHDYAPNEQSEANDEAKAHAHLGRNPIPVERVFDEKGNAQKECQSPTQANILTPMNCSQFMAGAVSRGGSLIGGSFGSVGTIGGMGGGVAVGAAAADC